MRKKFLAIKLIAFIFFNFFPLIAKSDINTPGEEAYLSKAVKMLVDVKKYYRKVNLHFKMDYALEVSESGREYASPAVSAKFVKLYSDIQNNMAFIQVYIRYLAGNDVFYNLKIQGYITPLSTAVIALNEMEATAQAVGFNLKKDTRVYDAVCNDYYFTEKMKRVSFYKSVFQVGVEKFRGWRFITYNCN